MYYMQSRSQHCQLGGGNVSNVPIFPTPFPSFFPLLLFLFFLPFDVLLSPHFSPILVVWPTGYATDYMYIVNAFLSTVKYVCITNRGFETFFAVGPCPTTTIPRALCAFAMPVYMHTYSTSYSKEKPFAAGTRQKRVLL